MATYTTTAKWALRRLTGSSLVNEIDTGFVSLSDDIDSKLAPFDAGALSSRPVSTPGSPSGKAGRTYYATDIGIEFRDTGTGWYPVGIPLGGYVDYAGASTSPCPELMAADGTAVSRTTCAALFALIGTTHGAGDGSTTFNLPDLRDRVAVGASGTIARGATGGSKTVALATGEMPSHTHTGPSHTHTMPDHTHSPQTVDVRGAAEQGILGGKIPIAGTNGATSTTPVATTAAGGGPTSAAGTGATGSAGSGTAHQNMQPYVGVNKLIRVL